MIYCLKKNSASISRVLYPRGVSIINLELRIATCFSCFLPSSLREQRSCTGILGIAAHRMLVSLPLCRFFVTFAGTKHCCLTAGNRDGALCCPDFPRDRGLKPLAFLPLSRDRPTRYIFRRRSCDKRICFFSKRSLLLIPFSYREPLGSR